MVDNDIVILTRFSRVTIHAAHKYLGLTTEVLRTEKAINDIACHPLPSSFYEGGGLQRLRQRFDRQSGEDSPTAPEDYFSHSHTSSRESSESSPRFTDDQVISESPQALGGPASSKDNTNFARAHSSRMQVQAGDLLTTTGHNDVYRINHRTFSSTGLAARQNRPLSRTTEYAAGHPFEDFDLRDEVMSCIAKSIGLHQPPLSGSDSVEASPAFSAARSRSSDSREPSRPFSSLSLLETGDDTSSMASSSVLDANGSIAALDNEVEILYFAAGSTLARAGEQHPGQQNLE